MSNIRTQVGKAIGKTLNSYNQRVKPLIDELKFKEEYQGRIIDCMVGEVDDNYIETPETDNSIVKLEHSKEGLVKVPSIKGKTILVDAEGNETDTPAEGCRLVSVGEDEDNKLIILSKNKNLFIGEIEQYFINSSDGENNQWREYWRSKEYIKCTPNDRYFINFKYKDIKRNGSMFFYDKDKKFISMTHNNPSVTPRNCEFVRIAGQGENTGINIDISKVTDIMFCKGANISDYIEPKQHKTEILLDEPLRSLPNGVCDKIVGNRLVKRIEENICVGDVSEKWQVRENFSNEEFLTFILFTGKKLTDSKSPQYICNIFPNVPDVWNKNMIGVTYQQAKGNGEELIWLKLKRSEFPNVDTLKEWLKNNNLIIYNEKMCETIVEMPNTLTLQGFDDTTMYIENSITPTISYGYNALIPYKEELKTQKEEVETNTLDIENNIIPYLMDMEFNLMLMEDN